MSGVRCKVWGVRYDDVLGARCGVQGAMYRVQGMVWRWVVQGAGCEV